MAFQRAHKRFSKRSCGCSITNININCATNSTNLKHTLSTADSRHDRVTRSKPLLVRETTMENVFGKGSVGMVQRHC
eukprot:1138818-Pelagomonas_calceolata.AAC.1